MAFSPGFPDAVSAWENDARPVQTRNNTIPAAALDTVLILSSSMGLHPKLFPVFPPIGKDRIRLCRFTTGERGGRRLLPPGGPLAFRNFSQAPPGSRLVFTLFPLISRRIVSVSAAACFGGKAVSAMLHTSFVMSWSIFFAFQTLAFATVM